jgi:hypothetical protein
MRKGVVEKELNTFCKGVLIVVFPAFLQDNA